MTKFKVQQQVCLHGQNSKLLSMSFRLPKIGVQTSLKAICYGVEVNKLVLKISYN